MPWDGVKFDQETHQNTLGKGIICQIIDREYYTVWPLNLATKELIWPMPTWEEREPGLKVAALHYGPIGDYGWTYEAHLGAQAMAEALPYVELSERESASGPDSPQILRECAEAGYEVIFCHGWDLGIKEVAQDYPDVIFMWGSGVENRRKGSLFHKPVLRYEKICSTCISNGCCLELGSPHDRYSEGSA